MKGLHKNWSAGGRRWACLVLLYGLGLGLAWGQTLHALLVINTEDEGIGCIYDLQNWERELGLIGTHSGLTVRKTVLKDNAWSVKDVSRALDALRPGADDTVLFYYSGHGFRWKDTAARWPVLALQNDGWMELNDIYQKLLAKKPRFLITMADCCNNEAPYAAPPKEYRQRPRNEVIQANYRALFAQARGSIIASGSIPGQYSLGGEPDGGVFTSAFTTSLDQAVKSAGANWPAIMAACTAPLAGGRQQPQCALALPGGTAAPAAAVAGSSPAAAAGTAGPGMPPPFVVPDSQEAAGPGPGVATGGEDDAGVDGEAAGDEAMALQASLAGLAWQVTYHQEGGSKRQAKGTGTVRCGSAGGKPLVSLALTVRDPGQLVQGITYMVNGTEDWVSDGAPARAADGRSALTSVVVFLESEEVQARYRVHFAGGSWSDWFSEGEVAADWAKGRRIDDVELTAEVREPAADDEGDDYGDDETAGEDAEFE